MRRLLLLALAACYQPAAPTCTGSVIVLAEDINYSSSSIGSIDPATGVATMLSGGTTLNDPVLATSGLRNFVISRKTPEVVYEIDHCGHSGEQHSAMAQDEIAAGLDANPQDVAVDDTGALWIARLGIPSVLITSPLQTVDLSAFDSDGNPDMTAVKIVGKNAFVALSRLNPYPESHQTSQVVVLDTDTKKLVTTISLAGHNPVQMVVAAGKIWLAEPGNFSDAAEVAAGVETIDPLRMDHDMVLSEATLGASVLQVAASVTCAAAIVADSTAVNATSLVSFAPDGTHLSQPVLSTPGFLLRGLMWTSDATPRLLVGDATNAGGTFYVHVFSADAQTCALTKVADWAMPNMPALAFAD